MRGLKTRSVLRSAERLAQGEQEYRDTGDPHWIWFLKRESTILLRRAIKVWLRIRFRR